MVATVAMHPDKVIELPHSTSLRFPPEWSGEAPSYFVSGAYNNQIGADPLIQRRTIH